MAEDRRQHVASRQCDELCAPAVEDCVCDDNQCVDTLSHKGCKSRLDFGVIAGIQHFKVLPERARGLLSLSCLRLDVRMVRVQ